MSLSDDPEISAAFGNEAAPETHPDAGGDPEISAAFQGAPAKSYSGGIGGTPFDDVVEHGLKSLYATGVAGAHTIHDFLAGKLHSIAEADKQAKAEIAKNAPAPLEKGSAAEAIDTALASNANPLNWPGWMLKEGGKLTQKGLEAVGVPSQYSTIQGRASKG